MPNARVLFVSPRADVMLSVRARLPIHATIERSDSVVVALRRVEHEPFDLILCDIDNDGMADLLSSPAPTALLDGDKIIAVAGPQRACANQLLRAWSSQQLDERVGA